MTTETRPHVDLYTDGACDPNPGPGGWAAILVSGPHEKVLSGSDPTTTNNRMELQAVLAGLQALKYPSQVTVHTDSRYVQQGITEWLPGWVAKNWRSDSANPVKNRDLWEALQQASERHEIDWQWVKGHAGHPYNERADRLAVAHITRPVDDGNYEVAIYVAASCDAAAGLGAWAALVQMGEHEHIYFGQVTNTTANQLYILGVFEGLRLLPLNLITRVFTNSDYLYKGVTEWLPGWQKNGWQTRERQPVKNAANWQALAAQLELRQVTFALQTTPDDRLAQAQQAAENQRKSA